MVRLDKVEDVWADVIADSHLGENVMRLMDYVTQIRFLLGFLHAY